MRCTAGMRARRKRPARWRRIPISVLAVASGACAATNYLDPSGPVYQGAHAPVEPAAAAESLSVSTPLRVVSFNIAFAREIDRALVVLQEEAPLRRPDVLALQEMDAPGVERIALELGLNYVYYPSGIHPKSDRDFGCAVLSPWPLEEPRKIVLPHAARITGLVRAVTVVTLRRGQRRFRIYAVHLPSPAGVSGGARREQVQVLLADAAASPEPVIVAGDFNTEDAGGAFAKAGFAWPTRDIDATIHALGVGFRYDHVFAKGLRPAPGDSAVGVVEDNRDASDHRPVWALLVPE